MRLVVLVSILVSMTACKKKEAPAATNGSAATTPATPTSPAEATGSNSVDAGASGVATATGSASAPTGKLNCDRILTAELRAKYYSDGKVTDTTHDKPYEGSCKVEQPNLDFSIIDVQCDDKVYGRMNTTIDGMKKLWKNSHEFAGIGKKAWGYDVGKVPPKDDAGTAISAWDDDSNCVATFQVPRRIDAVAFAKDLLATLPPK